MVNMSRLNNRELFLDVVEHAMNFYLEENGKMTFKICPNENAEGMSLTEEEAYELVGRITPTSESGVLFTMRLQGFGFGELFLKKHTKEGNYIGY